MVMQSCKNGYTKCTTLFHQNPFSSDYHICVQALQIMWLCIESFIFQYTRTYIYVPQLLVSRIPTESVIIWIVFIFEAYKNGWIIVFERITPQGLKLSQVSIHKFSSTSSDPEFGQLRVHYWNYCNCIYLYKHYVVTTRLLLFILNIQYQ